MSNTIKAFVRTSVASVTMATTVLGLGGFASVAPVLAVAPADYNLMEGNLIRATGDVDVFIINQDGYKRLFLNEAIFGFYTHLGGWSAIKEVSPSVRDAFMTSPYYRKSGDTKVYALEVTGNDTGVLHWVNMTGEAAAAADANFYKKIFTVNDLEFNWYTKSTTDYTSLPSGSGPVTPGGPLQGNAGSLEDADWVSSLNDEEVGEGDDNVKVAGLELDADNGSDIRLLSVKLNLELTAGAGSDDLDDYIGDVSIWFGSSKVGEVNVDEFSEDAGEWSKTISLSGDPVIKADGTNTLYVAISSLSTIDGTDLGANTWTLIVENIRFVDAQGAITTEDAEGDIGTETRDFSFESFATANDIELEMKEGSDNPEEAVIDADDSSDTDNVLLSSVTLKAKDADMLINGLTYTVTPSGTGDASEIASTYRVEIDGVEVQSLSSNECTVAGDCDGTGTATPVDYNFDDVDTDIDENDMVTVELFADINEVDGVIVAEGDGLTASIDNGDTDAEDQNGDDLVGGDLSGSVTGEEQVFFSEGVYLALVSVSESLVPEDGTPDVGTFVIKFKATSFDTDVFIEETCGEGSGDGVDFTFDVGPAVSCSLTSTADDDGVNGNFEVLEGDTEEFTLSVTVDGTGAFEQLLLTGVDWSTTDIAEPLNVYDTNLDDFETDPLNLSAV